jgi:general secretion pathway protein D
MKKRHVIILLPAAALALQALAQPSPAENPTNAPAPASASASAVPASPTAKPEESPQAKPERADAAPAREVQQPLSSLGTNMLMLNFRGASLDQVLNYFSEAAGFVINVKPGTSVRGKVDVWSNEPLTRDDAVNLLDTVLNQNNLAAIRNGKTLTIVNKDEAKTQNIPVIQGGDPDKIPITDKVVTQIIPVRFVDVAQLLKDLQPLVSSVNSTMTANEAGNAIVITDTQAVIHKVAEVIKAIDAGAEEFTDMQVFKLVNADPQETADLITSLFPDDTRNNNNPSPGVFGGFRRSFFGGGGGFGGNNSSSSSSNSQNQRIKKRNRVIAVADTRTASVVVSASRDLMDQIAETIHQLDADPKGRTTVKVYQFQNADPRDALPVLQDMFNKNTTQNSRNNSTATQTSPLQQRGSTQNGQYNSSQRSSSTMTPSSRGTGLSSFGQ